MSIQTCWSFLAQQSQFLRRWAEFCISEKFSFNILYIFISQKFVGHESKKIRERNAPFTLKCDDWFEHCDNVQELFAECEIVSIISFNEWKTILFIFWWNILALFIVFFISMWFSFLNLTIQNTYSRINVLNRSRSNAAFFYLHSLLLRHNK